MRRALRFANALARLDIASTRTNNWHIWRAGVDSETSCVNVTSTDWHKHSRIYENKRKRKQFRCDILLLHFTWNIWRVWSLGGCVNDIPNGVCIRWQMDNLDIRGFCPHGYEHDDGPSNPPKKPGWNSSSPVSFERTLTLETNEHCRHRWTFALLGGVDFSLLTRGPCDERSDTFVAVGMGTVGSGTSSARDFV